MICAAASAGIAAVGPPRLPGNGPDTLRPPAASLSSGDDAGGENGAQLVVVRLSPGRPPVLSAAAVGGAPGVPSMPRS